MEQYNWAQPIWKGENYPYNYNTITLFNLFQLLKIPFSFLSLSSKIRVDFSLYDISSLLTSWSIPNETLLIEKNQLINVPHYSLLYLNNDKIFVILMSYEGENVKIIHPRNGVITYGLKEFTAIWKGETLVLEKTKKSGNPQLNTALKNECLERDTYRNQIKIIDNFIDDSTCAKAIKSLYDPLPSIVLKKKNTKFSVDKYIRDSNEYKIKDKKITELIYNKASKLFGNSTADFFEPIQYVSYSPGQSFKPHYDVAINEPINRTQTIIIYLNDNFKGGETIFPFLDFTVKPKVGRALIFPNLKLLKNNEKQIELFSYHAAQPIYNGNKWIALFTITDTPRDNEKWKDFFKLTEHY